MNNTLTPAQQIEFNLKYTQNKLIDNIVYTLLQYAKIEPENIPNHFNYLQFYVPFNCDGQKYGITVNLIKTVTNTNPLPYNDPELIQNHFKRFQIIISKDFNSIPVYSCNGYFTKGLYRIFKSDIHNFINTHEKHKAFMCVEKADFIGAIITATNKKNIETNHKYPSIFKIKE